MKSFNKLLGFTLVELIVVITIVGILSTVGFVSYSGYLTGARDSNRFSQLTKLSDSLQTYAASKSLPLPDDSIDITASGSTNIIAYQGYVGVDVLETIDYTNGGKDPKDDSYFTYYLTKDRKSMQLLTFMEEPIASHTTTTYAADYEDRTPKTYGKKLGVLVSAEIGTINTPAQEISTNTASGYLDVVLTNTSYTAHVSDETSDKITGTGSSLMAVNPKSSCKRIKQTGGSKGNGVYTISPQGTDMQVYCDMDTDGGGWVMLFSVDPAGTTWKYDSTQWASPAIDTNISNIVTQETTSQAYTDFMTNEIAICRGIGECYTMSHNENRTLSSYYSSGDSYVDFSRGPSGVLPDDVGDDTHLEYLKSLNLDFYTPDVVFFNKYGLGINIGPYNKLGFQADNNNGWPSVDNIVIGIGGNAVHSGGNMNLVCSGATPYDSSQALSVFVPEKCMYEGESDTKMWYVMGR